MKLLVTGALQADDTDLRRLAELGLEVALHPDERKAVEQPEQFDAVICNGLFLYSDIRDFSNLKYIQLTSSGLDRVPLEYIREKGIRLCSARGVYSGPIAEFALWGVLELYKQGRFFTDNQRARRWEKHRFLRELDGKTVCILGCGSVGSACARRFAAFGCRILGVATGRREQEWFESVFSLDCLPDLLSRADIVVVTLPLTAETRRLFDCAAFARMKPGSVFVNLARGAIADTAALANALNGHLSGAVLDVFEEEPLSPASPLWEKENVILTPHNSFVGEHNHKRMMDTVIQNLTNRSQCL